MKGLVLVVDDDAMIVDLLETALEDEGYRVLSTVGAEAIPLAREQQPDVILLDINMPGMDGVEVSRHLRDDPATERIPIIVMSAQDRLRATGPLLAVNDRLPKPFEIQALYDKVGHWTQVP